MRGPEGGLVMVRGRAGGGGAPFNLGEMTVTRCTVRLGSGLVGHAYVAGREPRRAELAALVDALMQDPERADDAGSPGHRAAGGQPGGEASRTRRQGRGDPGAVLRHADDADMMSALTPGFAEPVSGAQSCFRLLLDAMARPGQVHTVSGVEAPAPLCNAAAAVALTLVDHETPLWLDPEAEAARAWIAFHTGAPVTDDPARAVFALALSLHVCAAMELALCPSAPDEAPETSATVILQVASLTSGTAASCWKAPACGSPQSLAVDGLPAGFRRQSGGTTTRCFRAAST